MLRAILFDWGNTLVRSTFEQELLVEGHRRALAAVSGDAPSRAAAFAERYAETVLPPLLAQRADEVDYTALVAAALAGAGADDDDAAVERFVTVEHEVWRTAHPVEPETLALLDAMRERGLAVGVASNLFDPPHLTRDTFARLGVLDRLGAVALSAEVGFRKPHPAVFERALDELGVSPGEAAHVGDRRREDVAGAAALGLRTIQACWFADDADGPEPTARAATREEVVAIVDRWLADDAPTVR